MKSFSTTPATNSGSQNQSKLRFAVLMIPAVYPIVTALLYAVVPFTEGWQIWQRTLLLTPVMVLLMAYVVVPFVRTRFSWFINTSITTSTGILWRSGQP
jgi:antibiotic biosynthesis monooxygenase (ABM) superfamily enzyme